MPKAGVFKGVLGELAIVGLPEPVAFGAGKLFLFDGFGAGTYYDVLAVSMG